MWRRSTFIFAIPRFSSASLFVGPGATAAPALTRFSCQLLSFGEDGFVGHLSRRKSDTKDLRCAVELELVQLRTNHQCENRVPGLLGGHAPQQGTRKKVIPLAQIGCDAGLGLISASVKDEALEFAEIE